MLYAQLKHKIFESNSSICKCSFFLMPFHLVPDENSSTTECIERRVQNITTMNMITFTCFISMRKSATDFLHLNEIYKWKWSKKSNQLKKRSSESPNKEKTRRRILDSSKNTNERRRNESMQETLLEHVTRNRIRNLQLFSKLLDRIPITEFAFFFLWYTAQTVYAVCDHIDICTRHTSPY